MSTADVSQAEIIEDRKKWQMKYFDYAEQPIKMWLAAYLVDDVEEIFPDFNNSNTDVIFIEDTKHYIISLTHNVETKPNGGAMEISQETLLSSDKLKRACSVMYDSVGGVFPFIFKSIGEKYIKKLVGICYLFDNATMSFGLHRYNVKKAEKQRYMQDLNKVQQHIVKLQSMEGPDIQEKILKVVNIQGALINKYNAITDVDVEADEKLCVQFNATKHTLPRLYIVVKEEELDDDQLMKRMPKFGTSFQDPEEDTIVDKFKKEFNVVE